MPRSIKQTILSYYDGFTPILALLAFFCLFYLKSNDNAAYMWFIMMPLALNLVQKKFCVLQKKVLSFGPNRTVEVRPNSSAEPNFRSITNVYIGNFACLIPF